MQLAITFALYSPILLITCVYGANTDCTSAFSLCAPPGAISKTNPQLGTPDFQNLFIDLLSSSLPPSKRSSLPFPQSNSENAAASLCCYTTLSCLLLSKLSLPFCYDRFTTNYYLPDGSYGTISNGSYASPSGTTANLITGYYELVNGSMGNIYSADEGNKPNTATLNMPTPYTSSGIGTAIPASGLGGVVTLTFTTTLPGTTIEPTTVEPTTLPAVVMNETVILPTTITEQIGSEMTVGISVAETVSPVTETGTVIPGSKVQGTTVPGAVVTVTTTEVGEAESSSLGVSATASTKKNEAVGGKGDWFVVVLSWGLVVRNLLRECW